jgi:hypothetical protein
VLKKSYLNPFLFEMEASTVKHKIPKIIFMSDGIHSKIVIGLVYVGFALS